MLHDAPNVSLGLACKSGWMTKELFVEVFNYFLKFMNASKSNPAQQLMDNPKSHWSVALVNAACDHGMTILTFPPHCNHQLQPSNICSWPLQSCYNSACQSGILANPGCSLTIYNLAPLSASASYHAITSSNIAAGF